MMESRTPGARTPSWRADARLSAAPHPTGHCWSLLWKRQVNRVVGVRAVVAARDRDDVAGRAAIDARAADDRALNGVGREDDPGHHHDLPALERESAVTRAARVTAAGNHSAGHAAQPGVRPRPCDQIAGEDELVTRQGWLPRALTRRVVDEVERALLLYQVERDALGRARSSGH